MKQVSQTLNIGESSGRFLAPLWGWAGHASRRHHFRDRVTCRVLTACAVERIVEGGPVRAPGAAPWDPTKE